MTPKATAELRALLDAGTPWPSETRGRLLLELETANSLIGEAMAMLDATIVNHGHLPYMDPNHYMARALVKRLREALK